MLNGVPKKSLSAPRSRRSNDSDMTKAPGFGFDATDAIGSNETECRVDGKKTRCRGISIARRLLLGREKMSRRRNQGAESGRNERNGTVDGATRRREEKKDSFPLPYRVCYA